MPEPILSIYQPQRRGNEWAAAAEIRTPQGKVRLMATAPQPVVARYLAILHTLVAYRRGGRPMPYVVGADEVGGFFDSIWKGIKSVVKHPVFKKVVGTVVDCIPVVGPALQKTGLTKMGLNALQKAAKGGRGARRAQKTLAGITQMARAGNPQAKAVNATFAAGAKLIKAKGGKGLQAFGGLGGAITALRNAKLGGRKGKVAKARLAKLVARAKAGDKAAIEAAAYMAGARSIMRAPAGRFAPSRKELEEAPELEELTDELEDLGELDMDDADFEEELAKQEQEERRQRFGEDVSFHDVSGTAWDADEDATIGALDRSAKAAALVTMLRRLRQRRRGVRQMGARPRPRR